MKLGFLAIARPTFDVPYSVELASAALDVVRSLDATVVGSGEPAMDEDSVRRAGMAWSDLDLDFLVVLQASFADSTLVQAAAQTTKATIVLWAGPEPRTGGRLRRNSFCGINLAAYVLRRHERAYRHLVVDPAADDARSRLEAVLLAAPQPPSPGPHPSIDQAAREAGRRTVAALAESRVGVVGERPTGFEPCDYDVALTTETTGVAIEQIPLEDLFDRGRAAESSDVAAVASTVAQSLDLAPLGGASIEPSLRLHLGLARLVAERSWDGLATRCWPECFTEFGGAACTAQSLLNSRLATPALCEADAYGVITALMLQHLAGEPAFVTDLVDLDFDDGTAVVWHCGLAPFSMSDQAHQPRATIHSNRQLPLLNEFPLKAGRVTVSRLSQSANAVRLVVGSGEMIEAPLAFSGTAGTIRFDTPLDVVTDIIMTEGLEHHYGIVYGDHVAELHAVADELGLEVVAL